MKHYAPQPAALRTPPPKLPPFHAVQTRQRADGWTPERQAEFIGHIAETHLVSAAVRAVSMSRESAYRLRTRPGAEGFAAVWDMALARRATDAGLALYVAAREAAHEALQVSRKVTPGELQWRIESGKWHVIMRGGYFMRTHQAPDNDPLLTLLVRVTPREAAREARAAR